MRQVHEHGISTRPEHVQRTKLLDELVGAERELPHRTLFAIRSLVAYRFVDHVAPAGEPRVRYGIEAGFVRDLLELRTAARGRGERRIERSAQSGRIEIDLGGECFKQRAVHGAVIQQGGIVSIEGRASLRGVQPGVRIDLYTAQILALNQAAMHGAVEHFVDGTEVFANLVGFVDHVSEKPYVLIGITNEVMHGNVAGLAIPVEPPISLLQA